MAKFYGTGTGANRGYWALQWRDGKGRWIEMGSIGRYSIGGVTYTGRMVGGDSADSINMERRTANGQVVDNTIDKISPKDFENLNVKALLDAPEGFSEDEVAQARRAENTRPTAASYPNGTKLTIDGSEHTKNDSDTWTDPSGSSVKNADIDSRMDSSSESSAVIPDEAELTQENILNATDGSSLSWNNKQYSRLDGKWFDEKTGKPVSDKTMAKKTDGDLSTEGGKESFTPTPASEYPTDTKLHAEMNDGQSTADLHKTDDNAWDITTDNNTTKSDDATADKVIEAADTLDDMADFLQNPEESEPTRREDRASTPAQAEDRLDEIESEIAQIEDGLTDEYGENARALNDEERARLDSLRNELDTVDQDLEDLRGTEGNPDKDIDSAKESVALTRNRLDEVASGEEEAAPTPEPEAVQDDTAEEVMHRLDEIEEEIADADGARGILGELDRELEEIDAQVEASDAADKDEVRSIIAERRAEIAPAFQQTGEARNDDGSINSVEATTLAWETQDDDQRLSDVADAETATFRPSEYPGKSVAIDIERERGSRRWVATITDDQGNQTDAGSGSSRDAAKKAAIRTLKREQESIFADDDNESEDTTATPEAEAPREETSPEPETAPEDAPTPERTAEDIEADLDTAGAAAMDAISDGSDEDLDQARTALLNTYQEAQRAIDSPDTSNEDKVRLQSKVEEVDRAVTAIDQEIDSRNNQDSDDSAETGWDESSIEGVEVNELEDGTILQVNTEENGSYSASVFPAGSDSDHGPDDLFDTPEEAREAAEKAYADYDSEAGTKPATHSSEDTEGGFQADPEKVDESLATTDVETSIRETQEAAEDGTLNVNDVDESADFSADADAEIRRTNAEILANPQDGDFSFTASGREQVYEGGRWVATGNRLESAPSLTNKAQKELNTSSAPEVILMGKAGTPKAEAPKTAQMNKHGIELSGPKAPDSVQILKEDGTKEVYTRSGGNWYRRLDTEGNLSSSATNKSILHAKMDDSRQVATHKAGAPAAFYGEKELSTKAAEEPQAPAVEAPDTRGGGLASPEAKHVPASSDRRKSALGSHITDRPAKTEPNKVLTQDGKRVGMSDSEGNTYYVGDRVVYTDRSNNVRSARILAVSERGKDKKPAFDLALDENDPETPEGMIPFDEWYAMSGKEREAAGLGKTKYSKTKSVYQENLAERDIRLAVNETRDDIRQEFDDVKNQGLVSGTNVEEPEILDDVSIDRVVRDGSTAIIGTTNKYGELFQRGEVVEYGPNGEVGTIVHVGEADNALRIAPNGQSTLESVYHHVDTVSHSSKPAQYYDKNYDLAPQDRVAKDLFNNEVRVGDTVYRGGFPFTVKDIYPDGSKIRVVGQDWAGEQGSAGSLSSSQLIDLGFDAGIAMEIGGAREHDFMPDHLQVFTGNVDDIKSIRTHDSHMMTLTRDSQGRVLDTQENRDALASRAIGRKGNTKQSNSALARYIAENGNSERYERDGIKPGDFVDSGLDQAAGDNLQQYAELTFGTDMVIPDNSRMGGYNKFGQPETYVKKDNRWFIEGVEGDDGMSANEFYQYRLANGHRTNPNGNSTDDASRNRLTYMGDADDSVVPAPGSKVKKTDDEKFTLMPVGSLVRFTDAEGNVITIRKAADGQWYRVSASGAYSGSRKPVSPKDVAGAATYRGHYAKDAPAPTTTPDTSSREAVDQRQQRQARQVSRNNKRRENGGIDRIYGTHTTSESTFREGVQNTEDVRDRRELNERLAAERDELARKNEESSKANEILREALRKAGIDPDSIDTGDDDSLTASVANRIVATRKGTDHVIAVYNRVSDNVWEHVSAKGYRREFVLEAMPSTPGVTYKVEEHVA